MTQLFFFYTNISNTSYGSSSENATSHSMSIQGASPGHDDPEGGGTLTMTAGADDGGAM